MPRLSLIPFVGLAALLALLPAIPRVAAPPAVHAGVGSDGSVAVDSTGDTNARDNVITLREAIMIVTGALPVSALDPGECDNVLNAVYTTLCVATDPIGAVYSDRIVFNIGVFPPDTPGVISLASELPPLSTGGDLIEGSFTGVIVDGTSVGFQQKCITIDSNGNAIRGLQIRDCSEAIRIEPGSTGNTIGGSQSGQGNVVSGNTLGVRITGPNANNNVVLGNHIGTNADGTAALGNQSQGVMIQNGAQGNVVGGSATGEGNLISGNGAGVHIFKSDSSQNLVIGNRIGINAAGTDAIPNDTGILLQDASTNNTIGGSNPGEGNVISGNDVAVEIRGEGTSDNTVIGNHIGTNADGNMAISNRIGLSLHTDASENLVGGVEDGEANVIAFNTEEGVRVEGDLSVGNTIRGNSIHSNGLLGIDNVDGGNTELAPPAVTGFGSVIGTACPNCTVDVYSDDEDEGAFYEGAAQADESGNWTLDTTPAGPFVTATATDPAGNTSEFSAPADPSATPTPTPVVTPTPTPNPSATATPTPSGSPTPTPSSTPEPQDLIWGDDDCNLAVAATDALKKLQDIASIPYSVEPGCPTLGDTVAVLPASSVDRIWGDTDCDGDYDAVDALQILRSIAALSVSQQPACPEVGDPVVVQP